ncbi:hypothetical protein CF319_g6484 [Tilletia indica]|nr:hypothetical protein CF319_g6484 [Tilletia indica]
MVLLAMNWTRLETKVTTPMKGTMAMLLTRKAFHRAVEEWSAACFKSSHILRYVATLKEAVSGSVEEILSEVAESLIKKLQQLDAQNAREGQPGPGMLPTVSAGPP